MSTIGTIFYVLPIIIMIAAIIGKVKKDLNAQDKLDISLVDMDPKVKVLYGSISKGREKTI